MQTSERRSCFHSTGRWRVARLLWPLTGQRAGIDWQTEEPMARFFVVRILVTALGAGRLQLLVANVTCLRRLGTSTGATAEARVVGERLLRRHPAPGPWGMQHQPRGVVCHPGRVRTTHDASAAWQRGQGPRLGHGQLRLLQPEEQRCSCNACS